jgi:hypothetical protein
MKASELLLRFRGHLGAAVVGLLATAIIAAASYPTGSPTLAGAVPTASRVAARGRVGDARVLLLSESRGLRLLIAYKSAKGWLGVDLEPTSSRAAATWSATSGSGDVPPLAVVYGRAPAEATQALVLWADGLRQPVTVALDGTFLAARAGRVRSLAVSMVSRNGSVVRQVPGP